MPEAHQAMTAIARACSSGSAGKSLACGNWRAIQIWIARQFPQARLLPADPLEQARAIAVMAWCASGIHPKLTQQARPERYCDLPGSADSVRALGSQSM